MPRRKKTEELAVEVQAEVKAEVSTPKLTPVLSFAEVMRINRELRANGMLPPDLQLPPKKRQKQKRF